MIGNRFGHQSVQHESSGHNSTSIQPKIMFRAHMVFRPRNYANTQNMLKALCVRQQRTCLKKGSRCFQQQPQQQQQQQRKVPATRLFSRRSSLGAPIYMAGWI